MRSLFSTFLLTVALFSGPADATLIGQEVDCISNSSGATVTCDSQTAIVGDGPEFTAISTSLGSLFEIDLFGDAIELRNASSSTFVITGTENLVLGSLSWAGGGSLTGFSLTALNLGGANPFLGFDNAVSLAPSFSGLRIDLGGVTISALAGVRINLEASHPLAVPEPSTFALLALGLCALCAMGRRRSSTLP